MIAFPDSLRFLIARILLVIVVFGIIWLLRNLLTWLLTRPLEALMRRINDRDAETHALIRSIVLAPTRYLLLAIGIDLSARVLELPPDWLNLALNVSRTLVIVALALVLFRTIESLVITPKRFRLFTGLTIEDALLPFVRTGFVVVTVAVLAVIVLQVWGYDITGLVAGLGIGGLAFSLAAQDLLSNLFGFAAVVSDRPLVVGEYIVTPDVEGTVEHVGIRTTRVRQMNQAVVYVPNSKLAGGTVMNWSRVARRWVDFKLRLEFTSSAQDVSALLAGLRALLSQRASIDTKSVFVYLVELAESALIVQVRCYVNIADFTAFTQEQERILLDVMRLLEQQRVTLALPSQTVYYEYPDDAPAAPPSRAAVRPRTAPFAPRSSAVPPSLPEDEPSYPRAAPSTRPDDNQEQA